MLYYLDAGSGSMLVQSALAGVAGAAVLTKMGWKKVTGPFRRNQSDDGAPPERQDAQHHADMHEHADAHEHADD